MRDIIKSIEWAVDTIRCKERFGLSELQAAYNRERRAKGVLRDCKKEIEKLTKENAGLRSKLGRVQKENKKLRESFISIGETDANMKAEFIGEFSFWDEEWDDENECEISVKRIIPWIECKEIFRKMSAYQIKEILGGGK